MANTCEPGNPFSAPGSVSAPDPRHKLIAPLAILTASLAVLFVHAVLQHFVGEWYVSAVSTNSQSAASQRLTIEEWLLWLGTPFYFGSYALRYWGLMILTPAASHRLTRRLATATLFLTATDVMLTVMTYAISRSSAISVIIVLASIQAYVFVAGKIMLMLTLYPVAKQVKRPDLARWFVFIAVAEACVPLAGRLYFAEKPHLYHTLILANWALQVASVALLFALLTAARTSTDVLLSDSAPADGAGSFTE